MHELLSIAQADALDRNEILVTLSDGRSLVLTPDQLLRANPRVLSNDQDEEDSN